MAFHFFTEPAKIAIQNANQAYGAIDINQYRLGNIFSANPGQIPKAFAVTDGQILVQKINSTNKYNIILKPSNQPDLGFPKIDYIIYKGIQKESLISGSLVASADKNDLTRIIHENATAWYNAKKPSEGVPPTEPDANRSLGLVYSADSSDPNYLKLDSTSLNEAFYATNGISLSTVFGGNHIGDFDSSGDIGIIIVFEKIGFIPTFKLSREFDSKIELTSLGTTPTNTDIFHRKNQKEEILAYVDSTAFFGAFSVSELMVYNGSEFEKKTGDILFSDVIIKHFNKNKIYFDIRNEYNDSFNYHENYDNNIGCNLDNTNSLVDINYYRNHGWPILVINDEETSPEFGTTNINKTVKLSFTSSNENLLIYYKKVFKNDLAFDTINDKIFYNPINNEGKFSAEDLKVPKIGDRAISNYFQLKILNSAISLNPVSPPVATGLTVKKETYLDNLFPIFDMKVPFDLNSGKSALKIYYDSNFIDKNYINSSNFTVNTGIAKDNNFTTFISFPHKYNLNIKQNTDDKIPLSGMEGSTGSLFLSDLDSSISKIKLVKSKFIINGADIEFLKFIPESNEPFLGTDSETISDSTIDNFTFDDVTVISLSNTEYATLLQLKKASFSDDYKVYLGIENVASLIDDIGNSYTKFEYCLRGLKSENGSIITTSISPSPTISSYTDAKLSGKPYERNYEEKIGYDNFQSGTLRYEDYFINQQATIKTVVDDFEKKLNLIDLKSKNIFKEIRALVKKQSSALWKTAYTYVQSHQSQPDDRPLYWARLKMAVMIKSYSYFLGDLDVNSNVIPGSQLDDVITLFEENTRNYNGINFSGAPVDAKKILITGFDPFFLNPNYTGMNILQSNPSGCVALSLNNKITQNELGYIQTMMVPVRYKDFDSSNNNTQGQGEGIIEKYIQPWIDKVDMVITISQSLPGDYNIDRYATSTRGGTIDNLGFTRATPTFGRSIDITNDLDLEWIETTLPISFINDPVKYDYLYKDKNNIEKNGLNDTPILGEQMKSGPGGNYLSNEIFYRVARLRKTERPDLSTGHFHISKLQDESIGEDFDSFKTVEMLNIVKNAINNGATGL